MLMSPPEDSCEAVSSLKSSFAEGPEIFMKSPPCPIVETFDLPLESTIA